MFNPIKSFIMEKKDLKKVTCADLVKLQSEAARDNFKRALGSYVQFLIVSDPFYRVRANVSDFIGQHVTCVLDMIDFEK